MAPVTLDVDTDRRVRSAWNLQEFSPRQGEGDQQNLVDPGMKRRRHLAEQHPGGVGIQQLRQVPGARIGIHRGLHRRQSARRGRDLPPGLRLLHNVGVVRMLDQQRRPLGKRCPRRRQRHRVSPVLLGPGNVDVLQHNSPRHPVDGQMMNDQQQLPGLGRPQRAQHCPRGRVQPRPRLHHRLIGERGYRLQAASRVN